MTEQEVNEFISKRYGGELRDWVHEGRNSMILIEDMLNMGGFIKLFAGVGYPSRMCLYSSIPDSKNKDANAVGAKSTFGRAIAECWIEWREYMDAADAKFYGKSKQA